MRQFLYVATAIIIVSIAIVSCEKDDSSPCDVSNPAEDIAWLKEAIETMKQDEYSYYFMATYKGNTVFYNGNCNPAANYASIVRNCKGDHLGYTNDLQNNLTNKTILWQHEASQCNLQE